MAMALPFLYGRLYGIFQCPTLTEAIPSNVHKAVEAVAYWIPSD